MGGAKSTKMFERLLHEIQELIADVNIGAIVFNGESIRLSFGTYFHHRMRS